MQITIITLSTLGTLLIGIAALRVHHHVLTEKKIDKDVIRTMRLEQRVGLLGMLLVALSYILHFV